MRKLGLALCTLLPLAGQVFANGRPAAVSSIEFRQTAEQDIVAGLTFGLAISHDGGTTWQWMCEKAVGYGGMFDPDYAYSKSGAIFATTFTGLKVMRDACSFDASATGTKFVSTDELDRDGTLYVGVADPVVNSIDRSTDDGQTFSSMTMPGQPNDWWESLVIAPSDPHRLYLTGYRFVALPNCGKQLFVENGAQPIGCGATVKRFLLFRSDDSGATWTQFEKGRMATSESSAIQIAGIGKTDPDVVYTRVSFETGTIGDALYRSSDAGFSWTKILAKPGGIAFVVRANGDLVAGTPAAGILVSHDRGDTWTTMPTGPHPNCLVENAAGEVWACTQNFSSKDIPASEVDGYGIMKSKDLATWFPVLKFQDLTAPVTCPVGTVQKDVCEKTVWCGLEKQMGITSTAIDCSPAPIPPAPMPDAGGAPPAKVGGGCCDAGHADHRGALLLVLLVGLRLRRERTIGG